MIIIGSLLLLIVPLIMAFFVARYCWRQGWCARLALVAVAALVSLHTHAYYFPDQPLKDRYAATLLKTSAYR